MLVPPEVLQDKGKSTKASHRLGLSSEDSFPDQVIGSALITERHEYPRWRRYQQGQRPKLFMLCYYYRGGTVAKNTYDLISEEMKTETHLRISVAGATNIV